MTNSIGNGMLTSRSSTGSMVRHLLSFDYRHITKGAIDTINVTNIRFDLCHPRNPTDNGPVGTVAFVKPLLGCVDEFSTGDVFGIPRLNQA